METINKTHFMDKAINGLRKASVELEEFQMQLSLGKSEAFEKYQEIKKKFRGFMHEVINKLREDKVSAEELTLKFQKVEHLLVSEKIETKENFNEQKKKILALVEEMEDALKSTAVDKDFHIKINTEIEKFKIKMEILRLRLELGKLDVKKGFESLKSEFAERLDSIKMKFEEGESALAHNWDHFSHELSEAYKHLKKAFILS